MNCGMKKGGMIVSALLGGTFFAVPFLLINIPILPSALIGAIAFGAGTMIFGKHDNGIEFVIGENSEEINMLLNSATEMNKEIKGMTKKLEDTELINNVNEIHDCSEKIVNTIQKNPKKLKQAYNFMIYYLPVTLKILKKYDEIENQQLTSKESIKFMENTRVMMKKIKEAFKEQL